MREIKFRAWRLDKMWYPEHLKNDEGENEHFKMDFDGKIIRMWDNQGLNNQFTLMQFTGLKDKNGKEIYEGDEMWDGQRHGQIKWNDANCKFILEGDDFAFEMIDLKDKNFSVGGNIYENPELLK